MRKLTRAYLAGLIDGEGYFGIRKCDKRFHSPVLKVCMCDKELITWLKSSFGGYMGHRRGHGNQRDSYSWEVYNNKAIVPIIKDILPYLRVKDRQARLLLALSQTFTGGKITDEIYAKREKYYHQIKELNKRGRIGAA